MYANYYRGYNNNNDRFVVPFLFGALAGGAAVGVTRPRPVYVNNPQPIYGPMPYYGGTPYYSYGYNYSYGPYYR